MTSSSTSLIPLPSDPNYGQLPTGVEVTCERKINRAVRDFEAFGDQFIRRAFKEIGEAKELLSSPLNWVALELPNLFTLSFFGQLSIDSLINQKVKPETFKILLEKFIQQLEASGYEIPEGLFSPERIFESVCPKQEMLAQMSSFWNIPHPLILEGIQSATSMALFGVTAPICEEIIFREGIQNSLLKTGAKKIVTAISPHSASLIDTKIYTLVRIIFASFLFAACHQVNKQFWTDEHVDNQIYYAFFMGLLLGAMREAGELRLPIAAHIVNNVVCYFFSFINRC